MLSSLKIIFIEEHRGLIESFFTWHNHNHLKVNTSKTSGSCVSWLFMQEKGREEGGHIQVLQAVNSKILVPHITLQPNHLSLKVDTQD